MRGEYPKRQPYGAAPPELPPRARRIHFQAPCPTGRRGTTSACAENTLRFHPFGYPAANYLRMRGEYSRVRRSAVRIRELPPHARRIPSGDRHPMATMRNYLRMRGEYTASAIIFKQRVELPPHARRIHDEHHGGVEKWELPPHARRILQRLREKRRLRGTTSACAENTLRCAPQSCCMRNYLRMRGEYYVFCITHHFPWELPPHARRIPLLTVQP